MSLERSFHDFQARLPMHPDECDDGVTPMLCPACRADTAYGDHEPGCPNEPMTDEHVEALAAAFAGAEVLENAHFYAEERQIQAAPVSRGTTDRSFTQERAAPMFVATSGRNAGGALSRRVDNNTRSQRTQIRGAA